MSVAERRQEEKEQRRNDIVDAAEVVFARKGVDKATIADVADEARLSRGLIYFYFKDKDALYLAIMLRATQTLYNSFVEATEGLKNGLAKIHALGRAYVDFHHKTPNYFDAMADFEARNIDISDPVKGEMDCMLEGRKILELMADVIREGMADGSIRDDIEDPQGTAVCLWGFTHGILQISAKKAAMFEFQFGIKPDYLMEQAFSMMQHSVASLASGNATE